MMQAGVQVFLVLLLGHFLADFLLQPAWVAGNEKKSLAAMLARAAIRLAACLLLLSLFVPGVLHRPVVYLILLGLIAAHGLFDVAKLLITRRKPGFDGARLFLLDQFLPVFAIVIASDVLAGVHLCGFLRSTAIPESVRTKILAVAVVYVGVVIVSGYLIRYLTRSLSQRVQEEAPGDDGDLKNAGLYIGWLERFLVLTAILIQSPALVGLILTGKSIARFPELKHPRFAEYFLIGTFLSLSLAVLGGIILLKVIWGNVSLK